MRLPLSYFWVVVFFCVSTLPLLFNFQIIPCHRNTSGRSSPCREDIIIITIILQHHLIHSFIHLNHSAREEAEVVIQARNVCLHVHYENFSVSAFRAHCSEQHHLRLYAQQSRPLLSRLLNSIVCEGGVHWIQLHWATRLLNHISIGSVWHDEERGIFADMEEKRKWDVLLKNYANWIFERNKNV